MYSSTLPLIPSFRTPALRGPRSLNHPAIQFGKSGEHPTKPLASFIDHTKLTYKPTDVPVKEIQKLCESAVKHHFYAVCVQPDMVAHAKKCLQGTAVKVATVVGFPDRTYHIASPIAKKEIGNLARCLKVHTAQEALKNGADELDVVINVSRLIWHASLGEFPDAIVKELQQIKALADQKPVKVILETDLLTPDQLELGVKACIKAGVDMIKTSTGMIEGGEGATVENIKRIKHILQAAGVSHKIGIKASGGVRTQEIALKLIDAGATRIGTSNGVALIEGVQIERGYEVKPK